MDLFKLFQSRSYFLFFLLFLASCSKSDSLSSLDQNKVYLTGVSSSPTKWNLISLTSSGTVQALTYAQKLYSKTFAKNGYYSDSDGFVGSWVMPGTNQLIERYINYPSGSAATQSYQIVSITATNLIITYNNNGTPITAVYAAGN